MAEGDSERRFDAFAGSRAGRALFGLLLAAGFTASALAIYLAALGIGQNSDAMLSTMAARSLVDGNLLLSGWYLPSDNFFFSDILPFAAFFSLFGTAIASLYLIPAFVYTALVGVCLAACIPSLRLSLTNICALATIILLAGLPPPGHQLATLQPYNHCGALLFAMGALVLFDRLACQDRVRRRPWAVAAFLAITSAASFCDPFTLFYAFGPAMLVLLTDCLSRDRRRESFQLLFLVLVPCILGRLGPLAVARAGGFSTVPNVSWAIVAPAHLVRSLQGIFFGFLHNSGTDIFGREPLDMAAVLSAVRLAVWLAASVAVAQWLRAGWRAGTQYLDRILLASLATLALACLFSDAFYQGLAQGLFQGGASARYLSPMPVFGAVLAARRLPKLIMSFGDRRLRVGLCGLLVGLGLFSAAATDMERRSPPWMKDNSYLRVARWLQARHLTSGIGGYWSSSIITAISQSRVTVRAECAADGKTMAPLLFAADANWYRAMSKPMFAIWQAADTGACHWDVETLTASFGAPARVETVEGFTVALWM